MSSIILATAALLIGFAIGSIPSGLWWGRLVRGVDVRQHGSRNLGATNVLRTLGPADGVIVLLLDVGKGVAAVLLSRMLVPSETVALGAGLSGVLGHLFSPWVGFRGGKGVATGLGIWIVLVPSATGIALATFVVVLVLSRRVSVASLCASAALLPAVYRFARPEVFVPELGLAGVTTLLVWMRHRGNIARLMRGQEPPLWGGSR